MKKPSLPSLPLESVCLLTDSCQIEPAVSYDCPSLNLLNPRRTPQHRTTSSVRSPVGAYIRRAPHAVGEHQVTISDFSGSRPSSQIDWSLTTVQTSDGNQHNNSNTTMCVTHTRLRDSGRPQRSNFGVGTQPHVVGCSPRRTGSPGCEGGEICGGFWGGRLRDERGEIPSREH